MKDLRLDTDTWDLVVASDIQVVEGYETITQYIRQRLQTFLGEWFLNLSTGVPWFQQILGKVQYLSTVETILKATIADSPGVKEVTSFSIGESDQERTIRVDFTALLEDGESTSDSVELSI